jgi:hypothetical protein
MTSDLYGLIGGVAIALVGFLLVYLRGRKDAKDKAEVETLRSEKEMREKIDDAPIESDPDLARRWLQSRDPNQR